MMVLAVTSVVVSLPALPLILATDVPVALAKRMGDELDKLDQTKARPGSSLAAYNACMARWLAQRAQSAPCQPQDRDCVMEQSAASCEKPTELLLIAQGDVGAALTAGGQVREPLTAMLTQRQTMAVAEVSELVRGYVGSLALTLLFAVGAAISALSLSRTPREIAPETRALERHTKHSAVLLAVVTVVATLAAVASLAQIGDPAWDNERLASSLVIAKVGAGLAMVAAIIAGAGTFYAKKALVALQRSDAE